jgi:hypothetical protein
MRPAGCPLHLLLLHHAFADHLVHESAKKSGVGQPIPPLLSEIQVATTNAGARAQGGLTPDFLAPTALTRIDPYSLRKTEPLCRGVGRRFLFLEC